MENRYVKAKVRATGEIVEVFRPIYESRFYRKDEPAKGYDYKELEFLDDGIDWEQRRFDLVKSLAAGRMLRVNLLNYNKKSFVSIIVELADDIIAEYRKGGEK